ncbi:hypothetical protein KQ945_10840 [Bacillus subtilis subsp. subtilis]|nr:hypothetical protein [Bacillus subtilis subsp. subtilis]
MPSRPTRFALCLLMAMAATPGLASPVAPPPTATRADSALALALTDSIALAEQGDSVGALIGFERVFDDPGAATLDAPLRLDGLVSAGRTAFNARQPRDAQRYLDAALTQAPDDAGALYVLGRLRLLQDQPAEGASLITRSLRASDRFLGDIDAPLVYSLGKALPDQPDVYAALLQVLFDRQWQIDGLEPNALWLQLATLQADAGQHERLAATVRRIDAPLEVVALRSDKRFDAVVDRRDPRFDPSQSARRHADALRVSALLRPEASDIAALTDTLLLLGDHEQVLATTALLLTRLTEADAPRSFPGGAYAAWVLLHRAVAQHRLGQEAQAEATLVLASTLTDEGHTVNPLHRLYLASWYLGNRKPERALQTLEGLDEEPMFGEYVRQWIRFSAYRSVGDAARTAQARRWLQDNQGEGRAAYVDVLLVEQRTDEAAGWVIAELQAPRRRQEMLQLMQNFRMLPPMPADVDNDARWQQLLKRPDVVAAMEAVGRRETLSIHSRAAWR